MTTTDVAAAIGGILRRIRAAVKVIVRGLAGRTAWGSEPENVAGKTWFAPNAAGVKMLGSSDKPERGRARNAPDQKSRLLRDRFRRRLKQRREDGDSPRTEEGERMQTMANPESGQRGSKGSWSALLLVLVVGSLAER